MEMTPSSSPANGLALPVSVERHPRGSIVPPARPQKRLAVFPQMGLPGQNSREYSAELTVFHHSPIVGGLDRLLRSSNNRTQHVRSTAPGTRRRRAS
uniref:Uncharacterized protein n=1 Tax=Ralstonia syzygii R24 TaxID=907261 RepID=G3A0T3_9RALS|nr:conserved hypothetical protein [Ralstonia syzygii R24]